MDMHEWHYENKVKPKQEWQRVSRGAKLKKLTNKKSKRDIEREERIVELGGRPIEVTYGVPLSEEDRDKRINIELDLKYPNRHKKKHEKRKPYVRPQGSARTPEEFKKGMLQGARARAAKYGIPFDLVLHDFELPEVCPVLGTPMNWGNSITENTPSLDRVVPELGYVAGNVNVISFRANRLKNNASVEELEAIIKYITGN